jgi:hypothetical protein
MQQGTLISIYLIVGLVCGGFVFFPSPERGARELGSALVMVVLWPLWAPFALASPSAPKRGPHAARIALALAHPAGNDGALQRDETMLLLARVEAAERRLGELDVQLAALQREVPPLEGGDADAGVRAQLRAASIAQLEALRAREHSALVELVELCELLRAQHLLSRFGGSERAGELRDELWARVQALSELEA